MARAAPTASGRPLSWEQFLALPGDLRAEYVDGKVFVSPPPTFAQQRVCLRLRDQLCAQVGPPAVVAVGVGWLLPGEQRRLRIPDLMLLATEPEGDVVTGSPLVVVEVLSTNRSDDLVRKSTEYLDAGAGQYWIVDPRDRVIDVFARGAGGWQPIGQLTDEVPETTVPTPVGDITLSLTEILG